MKRLMVSAAFVSLLAAPAFAASTTVVFTTTDGAVTTVVFNDDGTAESNGETTKYTLDEEAKTVCSTTAEGELCATFDELGEEVGFETNYTATNGESGTAKITAISE